MDIKWQLAGQSGNQPDGCLVGISNQYETNSFWWLTAFGIVAQRNTELFYGTFAIRSKVKNKSKQLETKEVKVSSRNSWHGYQRELIDWWFNGWQKMGQQQIGLIANGKEMTAWHDGYQNSQHDGWRHYHYMAPSTGLWISGIRNCCNSSIELQWSNCKQCAVFNFYIGESE